MNRRAAFVLLLIAFGAYPAMASSQTTGVTTGAIAGSVKDATGGALPGVSVVVSGQSLMGTRSTVTDASGRYEFPSIPVGEHTIQFTRAGFAVARHDGVRVSVTFTATIDVTLRVADVGDEVVVVHSSPAIDRQSTAIGAVLDAQQLGHLPNTRSMGAILAATPAVQVSIFEVGANGSSPGLYSAYGTAASNRPVVEGIHVTGILPSGLTLNYGSFEEVSVGTAAHTAEWPVPGVQMQFIVKSGGNRYHGAFYGDMGRHGWQSRNIDQKQIDHGVRSGGGLAATETNRLSHSYDVNAELGGYVRRDRLWWYASVRDQEVSTRQVNFPVKPLQTRLSNYTGKATYRIDDRQRLVAFVHVGTNRQPNRLDPFGAGGMLNANTALHASEASTGRQDAVGWIWKTEWNAALGSSLFAEAVVGQFGANRPETPNGTAPRFEDIDTLGVSGGNRTWQQDIRRSQLYGSVSYAANGWMGHHTIKAGGKIMRTLSTETWLEGYPGNVLHVLRNTQPSEVILFEAPSRAESGLRSPDAHVTDSWRVHDRLTLNVGVRYDRYQIFLPAQFHPAGRFTAAASHFARVSNLIDWNHFAPRAGAIFQAGADGRTILKLHYGRYWLAPGLETGFNASPNSSVWWRRYAWSDANGSGVWEPGEEGVLRDARGGEALESIDPGLQLPFVHEVVGGLERDLAALLSVRTSVVWRGERQQFQRQNVNRPFEAFTVPVHLTDPGPDGATGTTDDGPRITAYELAPEFANLPQVHEVRNVPNSDSSHWTWDVALTRRLHGRWSLTASFAHTWSHDQRNGYFGQVVRDNAYLVTPNDRINSNGAGQHEFRTWSAKAFATYDVGWWGLRVTPFVRHQSGQPFGRTFSSDQLNYGTVRILAEPVGTRRMDNVTLVDVRTEKTFAVGRQSVAFFVDVFNLLNANPAQNIIWSSGPSFLSPLTIVPPRIVRIGTTVEW